MVLANTYNRLKMTMSAAVSAAIATWNEKYTIPSEFFEWDDYTSRASRYWYSESMYNNIQYRTIAKIAAKLRADYGLYTQIRPIYNPVKRLVDMYPSKCYPGSLDMESLATGAIPIKANTGNDAANEQLIEALKQLLKWSNFGKTKTLYVRTGAKLGDVFLKVVDDRQREKVRLEVVNPNKVKWCEFDPVGNITEAWIEYQREDEQEHKYIYGEYISKEAFATFKDGQPYAYYDNMLGEPVSEWPNEYGFVPLVHIPHTETDLTYGMTPFHSSMEKIHGLNDAASIVNDAARLMVQQMLVFTGINKETATKENASAKRDEIPTFYLPSKDASVTTISPSLNLQDALQNVAAILEEIERDLPELALHRLRDTEMSGVAIRNAYGDAISKFTEANGQYDDGFERAAQMGISIGGHRGYKGFEPFNLDSYDRGDLEFSVKERDIVQDTLPKETKLNLTLQAADNPAGRLVLSELEYSEEQIDEVMNAADTKAEMQARNEVNGFLQSMLNDPNQQQPQDNNSDVPNGQQQPDQPNTEDNQQPPEMAGTR